jgi:hypothetical protein
MAVAVAVPVWADVLSLSDPPPQPDSARATSAATIPAVFIAKRLGTLLGSVGGGS